MPAASSAILVRDLTFRFYPESDPILNRVSFDIHPNEIVTMMGRSGAGKTTLLRCLSGLEMNWKGKIEIFGQPISGVHRKVQILFQDDRLLPWLTVRKNILFGASTKTKNDYDRLNFLLDLFGLSEIDDHYPKTLSGGERTRVALARSLMAHPKILLLDEPFKGLDIGNRLAITSYLQKVSRNEGITMLVIGHDIEDALELSDRIILVASDPMEVISQESLGGKSSVGGTNQDGSLRRKEEIRNKIKSVVTGRYKG